VKISREFKVGITAIVALALLYWGLGYLKGNDILKQSRVYYAVYDKVDGLSTARPVTVDGFKVGQVEKIRFHPTKRGMLLVRLNITDNLKFGKGTVANIYSSGLLGEKAIELVVDYEGPEAQIGDTLLSGMELSLTEEVNRQVLPLKQKAESLIGSIDSVLVLVSGFLSEDTQQDFGKAFSSIRRSISTLEHTITSIDGTVAASEDDIRVTLSNFRKTSEALSQNTDEMENILKNVEGISDSLAQMHLAQTFRSFQNAVETSEEIMRKIEEGEGSAGQLINNPELYQNLEEASRQLDLLLLDLRYNPNRYVNFSLFGGGKTYSKKEIEELEQRREAERQALQDSTSAP